MQRMAAVVSLLPAGNLLIFDKLIGMFVRIAEASAVNKMNPFNMAIVFAPTLLRYDCTDLSKLLQNSEAANRVIEFAIVNHKDLFSVGHIMLQGIRTSLIGLSRNAASG
jgi:hypothetical protein